MALAAALPAAAAPAAAADTCPRPQAPVHEVFIAADCSACWAATGETAGAPGASSPAWRLDWIVPAAADADMAAAALPEAVERAQRLGRPLPAGGQLKASRNAAAALPGLQLQVVSGPAWQGYIGVELSVHTQGRTRLPAGSSAWMALVETVDAGSEGSTLPRALLRTVAGPMPLPPHGAAPLNHLRALRWPASSLPERLRARAWIEGPDGRLLAMAGDRCP